MENITIEGELADRLDKVLEENQLNLNEFVNDAIVILLNKVKQ